MQLPNEPRAGEPLRAAWGAQVIRYLRSITSRESPDILPQRGAGGTTYQLRTTTRGVPPVQRRPLEIQVTVDSEGDPAIRVYASTIAGGSSADIGFADGDEPPYLLTPAEGVVQGGITIDETGAVTSRWIEIVGTLSEDTETHRYVEIGTVTQNDDDVWIASNSRYGPISAEICRDWFSWPAHHKVTFI